MKKSRTLAGKPEGSGKRRNSAKAEERDQEDNIEMSVKQPFDNQQIRGNMKYKFNDRNLWTSSNTMSF